MYENATLSFVFMPTKTRKSYSLKECPLEALLVRCADTGMTWRSYCGESLATHFCRAECQLGGLTVLGPNVLEVMRELQMCGFWWVCYCNQRSEFRPAHSACSSVDSATEYLKSPLFQISQGLSLQYVCHCDSAPEQLICFGGILMGIPLSQQPPNILQRGKGSHAFVVSVNRCPLAFYGLVGYSGEKQREADAYFPFSPYQQLSGF